MANRRSFTDAVVFGSRARGDHRLGSDLDLAIFGALPGVPATLVTEFIDSDLPIAVDVVDFDRTASEVFRKQILRQCIPCPLSEESAVASFVRSSAA